MNGFDFWQRWGQELGDNEFARAFTALGILATPPDSRGAGSGGPPASPMPSLDPLYEAALLQAMTPPAVSSCPSESMIPWRFPGNDRQVLIGDRQMQLSSLDPRKLATAWAKVIMEDRCPIPRLQIIEFPATEQVRPWFRLLFEARPEIGAAHILFDAAQAHLHMKWPLRFGFLPGDAAEADIAETLSRWPSNELARAVRIDRDHANCDVLLFNGSSGQLLKELLEIPIPQKVNLFIVRGTFDDDLVAMSQRLAAIAAEARASGFAFLNPDVPVPTLSVPLNRLIENLSHNQPFDVAISDAFAREHATDPVVFLSKELATFQIDRLLEKIHTRLSELPKSACLDLTRETLERMNMPVEDTARAAGADIRLPAEKVRMKLHARKSAMQFDGESKGAQRIAEMNAAIDRAERQLPDGEQPPRFLQEKTFVKRAGGYVSERRAFQEGMPSQLRVRIGPPDEEWNPAFEEFPVGELPQDRDRWRLTVVLTEPNHLREPQRKCLRLPKYGPSTECEFHFVPRQNPLFEGRLTVLHRGRILQTAVLKGRVVSAESAISSKDEIEFVDKLAVRSNTGDLEERRQFDLALILNHTTDRRPRLTAISTNHAWVVDLTSYKPIALGINATLRKVADSVVDYSGDLTSKDNVALLVRLARFGNQLYQDIVEFMLNAPTNRSDIAENIYIQIVSTKNDVVVPFEFIYDHEFPDDDATLCPSWREALTDGKCRNECATDKGKRVCPLGFWGVSKVIERHDLTPELARDGKDFFLQSEPTTGRWTLSLDGAAVVAASEKVKDPTLEPVLKACRERLQAEPTRANTWDQWVQLVQQNNPNVLIALTHTDRDGIDATLEIGGKTIMSGQIKEEHVRKAGTGAHPVIALLGCDTVGTALEYGSHVERFRRKGAGVVIGTIASVFGDHAAKVAEMLVRGLKEQTAQSERLGEVIRSIKRKALLDGMVIALCVAAFGDADWKLK